MNVLIAIAATILGMVIFMGLSGLAYLGWRRQQQQRLAATRFCEAVDKLTLAAGELSDVPRMIAGHAKAAQAFALEVSKLRVGIDRFSKLLLNPKDHESGVTVPTDDEKDLFFEAAQILADNPDMGLEESRVKAAANLDTRASMSSMSLG